MKGGNSASKFVQDYNHPAMRSAIPFSQTGLNTFFTCFFASYNSGQAARCQLVRQVSDDHAASPVAELAGDAVGSAARHQRAVGCLPHSGILRPEL